VKLTVTLLAKKFPAYMKFEGSLRYTGRKISGSLCYVTVIGEGTMQTAGWPPTCIRNGQRSSEISRDWYTVFAKARSLVDPIINQLNTIHTSSSSFSYARIWVRWPVPRQLIKSTCHVSPF
jgi:hypothetical protein